MYQAPKSFATLRENLKDDLQAHGVDKTFARLIINVELGFELLRFLAIDDEPVGVLWVILSQTPIRDSRLLALTPEKQRAIANARILLPGFAGRFGWEGALRDYIRHIPAEMRRYDFNVDRLENQIVNACLTGYSFQNRVEVYRECLTERLPFKSRGAVYADSAHPYYFNGPSDEEYAVSFTEEMIVLSHKQIPQFSADYQAKSPITIQWHDLEKIAVFIDTKEGKEQWQKRLSHIRYRNIEAVEANNNPDCIEFNGFKHLAGMVASGKSTLMTLIAAHLVYETIYNSQPLRRVTLVVGDAASSIQTADMFNQWFCNSAENDTPKAVPLLGRTTRERHLQQLYDSREYKKAVQEGRTHWGERFLNSACPLQGLILSEKPLKPIIPGKEPCTALKQNSDLKAQANSSLYLCPLFSICPAQQLYRDMVDAQIWITTPGAMGMAGLPAQMEFRPVRMGDLIYEQSDLVVFDEVDTIIEWFDRLYAQETKLTGGGDGVIDKLDRQVAEYWSKNRVLPPQIRHWVEAQRNFLTPIGNVLSLLNHHSKLQADVERGYFTSRSLFYRLARRLLGLKEYEDETDDQKRQKNEKAVNCLISVFDKLMASGDSLAQTLPDTFRADRKVTVSMLLQKNTQVGKLPPNQKPGLAEKKYQEAVDHTAHQLLNLMQQTMNIGDSTQDPTIHLRYRNWIQNFVPDIEKRLDKLRQNLEAGDKPTDKYYLASNQIDTLETLAHRLEFAVNVALLDRHNRIVFYQWDSRPIEAIDRDNPYGRVPATLLNILPVPPTGRRFGIYHIAGNQGDRIMSNAGLSTFGYTNIGRTYVTNFHQLRLHLDGRCGPNVLAMSGTSFLPDSSRWHLDVPPAGILEPSEQSTQAIRDKDCGFKFMPVYHKDGEPVRVSGVPDKRDTIRKMAAELVGDFRDNGGRLADELRHLDQLARHSPENWQDRSRLLLLVNSYDQCRWVAEEIQTRWAEEAEKIYYLQKSTADEASGDEAGELTTGLSRVDIEQFAQTNGIVLIAPLQAIGRGFNILNENQKAAFGAVYFLTRPMPQPHDVPAIAQEINRRVYDWFNDENFAARQEGDGIYQRGLLLRRYADEYWRRVEARSYYRLLYDEKDVPGKSNEICLHENPRRDLAATTAGKIIQAVGRLLRGNVPFHAYFVDAAWAPQQAKRLINDELPLDSPKTSLLAAIIEVMADYTESPIGNKLYQSLFEKLESIENFDWQPLH